MDVYEPREDSELLKKYVKKYASGRVLDMGTGSGLLAEAAAKKKNVSGVVAVDINPEVKKYVKNIRVLISDLFDKVKGKYDTIIFNPPYLPQDVGIVDKALYGGKLGFETLVRFLGDVSDYLKDDGRVLVVFSNLTRKNEIDSAIEKNLLEFSLLEKMQLPMFEELYVYLITKSKVLKHLKRKKVSGLKYLAHGKRGMVFTGRYKSKKIAVKVKKKSSEALGRIKNESFWLKRLNKIGIGPKLLFHNENFLVYEFINGVFIMSFLDGASAVKRKKILKKVFMECFMMDELRINKEEMHHPLKHVIVDYPKAVLIDFERVHYSSNPHNVTQFVQFVSNILKLNKKKMRVLAQRYKQEMTLKNLKVIMKEIK